MINCHTHIFRNVDVPEKFLPLKLIRVLAQHKYGFVIAFILDKLIPFSDTDVFSRYSKFLTTGNLASQKDILKKCKLQYPAGTKFVVLPMDMSYMGAGKVPRYYDDQLYELYELSKIDDSVIPFIHIDPRRPNQLQRLQSCIENFNFKGVKIYPTIGYYPNDIRLNSIYDYCEKNNIPIIAHCSPKNPVYYKGSKNNLLTLLSLNNNKHYINGKSKKELCAYFAHPHNWIDIAKTYPKLRICLSHFGSAEQIDNFLKNGDDVDNNWFTIIKNMLLEYENIFTDISFTFQDKKYFGLLNDLLDSKIYSQKILFGTDYYMNQTKTDEYRFNKDLKAFIGEDKFFKISTTNTNKFLFNIE